MGQPPFALWMTVARPSVGAYRAYHCTSLSSFIGRVLPVWWHPETVRTADVAYRCVNTRASLGIWPTFRREGMQSPRPSLTHLSERDVVAKMESLTVATRAVEPQWWRGGLIERRENYVAPCFIRRHGCELAGLGIRKVAMVGLTLYLTTSRDAGQSLSQCRGVPTFIGPFIHSRGE